MVVRVSIDCLNMKEILASLIQFFFKVPDRLFIEHKIESNIKVCNTELNIKLKGSKTCRKMSAFSGNFVIKNKNIILEIYFL